MEARLMLSASEAEAPAVEEPALWLPGSISGAVYASADPASPRQASDPGVAGVALDLLDDQGRVVARTTTDEVGRYEFSPLAPGRYAIREHQPAGLLDGQAWIGDGGGELAAIDVIGDVWVAAGANLAGYDFAERQPEAAAATADLNFFAGAPALPFMATGETPEVDRYWAAAIAETTAPQARPQFQPTTAAVVAPPAPPVFGGSSRELNHDSSASEIKRTVAEPAGEWAAKEGLGEGDGEPVRVSLLPAEEKPTVDDAQADERTARDRAFELDGDDAQAVEPSTPPTPRAADPNEDPAPTPVARRRRA